MAQYIDVFLLPIAAANVEKYQEIAQKAGAIWKDGTIFSEPAEMNG